MQSLDEWRPVISQTSFDKSLSLFTFDHELLRLGLPEEATVGRCVHSRDGGGVLGEGRACWLILVAARLVLGQLLISN